MGQKSCEERERNTNENKPGRGSKGPFSGMTKKLTRARQKKAESFYTNANAQEQKRAKATLLRSLQGKNGNRNRE